MLSISFPFLSEFPCRIKNYLYKLELCIKYTIPKIQKANIEIPPVNMELLFKKKLVYVNEFTSNPFFFLFAESVVIAFISKFVFGGLIFNYKLFYFFKVSTF